MWENTVGTAGTFPDPPQGASGVEKLTDASRILFLHSGGKILHTRNGMVTY